MTNPITRAPLRFHENVQTTYQKLAGGPAWVDTDISALVGTGRKLILFRVSSSAGVGSGVREPGSAVDTTFTANIGEYAPHFAYCDANGHVEMYQAAGGNNNYQVIGYLQ